MKTLYSSTFISVALGFLMLLGGNNYPIETVEGNPPSFNAITKVERGIPNNSINIEIFDAFNCTDCADFSRETLPKIKEEIAFQGKANVNIFVIPDPSNDQEMQAALAAKCAAKQRKFWVMHSKLHNQGGLLEKETILNIAEELEMNKDDFGSCLDDADQKEAVEKDIEYAKENNIDKKPTIFVNNYKLIGKQPFENILKVIDIIKYDLSAF